MRALLFVLLLGTHQAGPAGRPPVSVDCPEIPRMARQLKEIRANPAQRPDVRQRADRLLTYLRFYQKHECQRL